MVTGNINIVPVEIFKQILSYIPTIGNAKSILGVNWELHATYKGMLQDQKLELFDTLLKSVYGSTDHDVYANSNKFLNFCKSFDMIQKLNKTSIELIKGQQKADLKDQVIQNLIDYYKNSPNSNGWWPVWL